VRIQTSQLLQYSSCLASIIGFALLPLTLSGCQREESQGAAPPRATPVKIAVVISKPISETSTYVGTLKCRKSVTIRPRVSGYLTQIYVRSGDIVKAGSLLLEVDPAKEQEALNTQLASLESNTA
jgi:multidrug efflux pump subunit AcrA (membrane-fusion protein)